ncbi:MAG TPA: hypothetical protein VGQ91_03625 [Ideonella sp.]|jgi:hypothetical protein|nr:hypothetical protein [Ideonella sp.]
MTSTRTPTLPDPRTAGPCWTTSSFGDAADTSPIELSALREHLARCRVAHGSLFELRRGAEAMAGFVAARQVTTLVTLAVLIGVASWWWV